MNLEEKLKEMLKSEEFQKFKKYYEEKSIIDICGISRQESVHSNFIYWLLNAKDGDEFKSIALKNLISAYFKKKQGKKAKEDNSLEDVKNFINQNYEIVITNFNIEREKPIKTFGRLDLFIEFEIASNNKLKGKKVKIIIENKIYSPQHDNQTTKYDDWINDNTKENEIIICIYLSPDEESPKDINENFIHMNYDLITQEVIEKCLLKEISDYNKNIILSYLRSLSFTETKDNLTITTKELNLVDDIWNKYNDILKELPYTKEEKKIKDLYEENKDQFYKFLYILTKKKKELFENEAEKLKEFIEDLLKISFEKEYKTNKYKSGDRKYPLKKLALIVLQDYCKENKLTIEKFNEKFVDGEKVCTTAKKMNLIETKERIEEDPNLIGWYFQEKEDLIKMDNKEYCLYAWWSAYEVIKVLKLTGNS